MSHQHAAGGNETITAVEEPDEENKNLIPATRSFEKDISDSKVTLSGGLETDKVSSLSIFQSPFPLLPVH